LFHMVLLECPTLKLNRTFSASPACETFQERHFLK
jgi:hypothetical protein